MAGGPLGHLGAGCSGDSYRRVLLDCESAAVERLCVVGRLDILRRATWPTRGDSWASPGGQNGPSLSRLCTNPWGCLQPLRARTIHTGWT